MAQNLGISPTTGQNNRYATDYSGVTSRNGQGQIYKSGSVNSPFDAPQQEQDALTLAEEDQKDY